MSAYVRPGTIEEALALLDAPGVQPLAGGTDLVPLQSRGKARRHARRRARRCSATRSSARATGS